MHLLGDGGEPDEAGQLGRVSHAEFLHGVAAVDLHGDQREVERVSDFPC
jgi:hypothetical protein